MMPQSGPEPFLVTAIVSVFRSGRFMRGCMEDLVGQDLFARGAMEILVVDSNSDQGECDVVLEYATRFPDSVRYLRTSRRESLYASWNRAAKASRGRFLTSANTDDRHRHDSLGRMAEVLGSRPEIDLVYADSFVTYQADATMEAHVRAGVHRRPDWSPEIMLHSCHMGPQPMWRRSVHERIGWFDERLRSAGDFEFWLRMASDGMKMLHLKEYLGLYFENPTGICNAAPETSILETREVQARFAGKLPEPTEDHRDNYVVAVYDPTRYARVVVDRDRFGPDLEKVVDALVENTAYPHVVDVRVGREAGDLGELETWRRQGRIRAIVSDDHPDGEAQAEVVVESLEEISRRGWLESRLLPPGILCVGELPLGVRVRRRSREVVKSIRRIPVIVRRNLPRG